MRITSPMGVGPKFKYRRREGLGQTEGAGFRVSQFQKPGLARGKPCATAAGFAKRQPKKSGRGHGPHVRSTARSDWFRPVTAEVIEGGVRLEIISTGEPGIAPTFDPDNGMAPDWGNVAGRNDSLRAPAHPCPSIRRRAEFGHGGKVNFVLRAAPAHP